LVNNVIEKIAEKQLAPEAEVITEPPQVIRSPKIDLQTIPGVTVIAAQSLQAMGVHDYAGIVRIGEGGLRHVKGIGDARAKSIFTFAEKMMKLNG
jgi:hypothetical protein